MDSVVNAWQANVSAWLIEEMIFTEQEGRIASCSKKSPLDSAPQRFLCLRLGFDGANEDNGRLLIGITRRIGDQGRFKQLLRDIIGRG